MGVEALTGPLYSNSYNYACAVQTPFLGDGASGMLTDSDAASAGIISGGNWSSHIETVKVSLYTFSQARTGM